MCHCYVQSCDGMYADGREGREELTAVVESEILRVSSGRR